MPKYLNRPETTAVKTKDSLANLKECFANGQAIEYYSKKNECWKTTKNPGWKDDVAYRLATKQPPVVKKPVATPFTNEHKDGPWIVIYCDGHGVLHPSPNPMKHGTKEKAKEEALRLAMQAKDKLFVVFDASYHAVVKDIMQ